MPVAVVKLNASVEELVAAHRRAAAHQRWRAAKAYQIRDVGLLVPVTLTVLGTAGLVPSVWYATTSDGSVAPAVTSAIPIALGVALLIPRVRKRLAIRREIAARDGELSVLPTLSAAHAGLSLSASF